VVGEVAQAVGQLRHDRALVAQPDLDLDECIVVLVIVVGVKGHARAREERIRRGRNRDAALGHGAPPGKLGRVSIRLADCGRDIL
jgi:hypothetical protein